MIRAGPERWPGVALGHGLSAAVLAVPANAAQATRVAPAAANALPNLLCTFTVFLPWIPDWSPARPSVMDAGPPPRSQVRRPTAEVGVVGRATSRWRPDAVWLRPRTNAGRRSDS